MIGFEGEAEVLLVGVARPGHEVRHQVCIEPEDGRWSHELFGSLPEAVEKAFASHPMQKMYYGDEPSMRDKPENIRRLAISEEVLRQLRPDDERSGKESFWGSNKHAS